MYYADLHVHSRYSRATSRDCDLEHLAYWARRKGITVVGTGDFTHPAWRAEIREKLVPAEAGLFRLRPELERAVDERLPPACRGPVRFLLSVEISTIYKKGDRTRKVHHLVYAPGFEAADAISARLARIGNIASDGRPILGLDSRHLMEIVLESGPDAYLVPAHIWTPWFAALGSKSGFDSVADCYGDLSDHIFAVETGLSSDPPMNWRVSSLDRYRLISNSDAHSPAKLGREACAFHCDLDYFALRHALETGAGYGGTVEFFPEEGKYHLDGHRACGVRLSPGETAAAGGRCPVCEKPVTVGVMHRVEDLADRPEGYTPAHPDPFRSLVPLPEILSEIEGVGPDSRAVQRLYDGLLGRLGPELALLGDVPIEDLRRGGSALVAEAVSRLRAGEVIRDAGYDGEYGVIRVFRPDEVRRVTQVGLLVDVAPIEPAPLPLFAAPAEPVSADAPPTPAAEGLDPDQAAAAALLDGPVLVIAGPGTGKTRTLTHRLARLVRERGVPPEQCLAVTFTRRAAAEMAERLEALLPGVASRLTVTTFHGLGWALIREHRALLGLHRSVAVAGEAERSELLAARLGVSAAEARRHLPAIADRKRRGATADDPVFTAYAEALQAADRVDFDDLVGLAVELLEAHPDLAAHYRDRWRWISIDEYQDIDERQYRLVRCLAGENLCAIGDPDQAIYGFRGADVRYFLRFREDFPGTRVVRLTRNYRSTPMIVDAAGQVIAGSSLVEERALAAVAAGGLPIAMHAAATERAEAEYVVKTLERLIGGHAFFSIDTGRAAGTEAPDHAFSDFAVLYRTDAQSAALVEALARSGIPFQKRAHARLGERADVAALVEAAARLDGLPVPERLRRAADDATRPAVDLLLPLANEAADFDAFRAALALAGEVDTWDPRADRVSLLTLHAAKGLEFRVVFIVGCEDGLVPLRLPDADPEEERRLFYVGMTRARERLYLLRARKRRGRGRVVEAAPSPFLAEIEARLVRREADAAFRPDPQLRLID